MLQGPCASLPAISGSFRFPAGAKTAHALSSAKCNRMVRLVVRRKGARPRVSRRAPRRLEKRRCSARFAGSGAPRRSHESSLTASSFGGVVERLRLHDRKIVFTNGVFDLLHVGHLRLLEKARALGDALIVAINSDDSARRIKGAGRPVIPQFARAQALADLRPVSLCFIFPETDPRDLPFRTVRPEVLVKGSEYPLRRIVGARFVSGYGGKVVGASPWWKAGRQPRHCAPSAHSERSAPWRRRP